MIVGQFNLPNNETILTNAADWSYYVAAPAVADGGDAPTPNDLSGWIQAANGESAWQHPSAEAAVPQSASQTWGVISGIDPKAEQLWTSTYQDNAFSFVVFKLSLSTAHPAIEVAARVDADNHYGLFTGDHSGNVGFIGRNEVGPAGSASGPFNWSNSESWNFTMTSDQYIYGVAWDGSGGGDYGGEGRSDKIHVLDPQRHVRHSVEPGRASFPAFLTMRRKKA